MNSTEFYNLNKPTPTDSADITLAVSDNMDIIDTELKKGFQSYAYITFTAVSDNTTNIVHGQIYNPLKDILIPYYQGFKLEKTDNYTENSDDISIDLVDWSISTGEKITFSFWKAK